MAKNTVLMICPFAKPNLGGVESHIEKLINFAEQNGIYTILLTYQPLTRKLNAPKHEKFQGYEIHRVGWFGTGIFPRIERYFPLVFLYLFPGLFIKSLFFYLRNHEKIDCIHAHGLAAAVIAKLLAKIYPKRRVVSTHAVYSFAERSLLSSLVKMVLSDFDSILAVSEVSKEELAHIGLEERKIFVHPNWIDTGTFKPAEKELAKHRLDFRKRFNFLFVGRLLEIKGVKTILGAAAGKPEFGFHIVGDGPLEKETQQRASELENLKYYGVLRQEVSEEFKKLLDLYVACDFFISPYTYDEGYSTTLIESLASGTPVVVSDRGSPPTFLSKEVAIFLSPNPNAEELEVAVEGLSKITEDEYARLSQKCRDFALDNFGSKNAEIILDSYGFE